MKHRKIINVLEETAMFSTHEVTELKTEKLEPQIQANRNVVLRFSKLVEC